MKTTSRSALLDAQTAENFALLSPATGKLPEKMLLLSVGSGIGPLMDMLRDLYARHYAGDVVFMHAVSYTHLDVYKRQVPGRRFANPR